MFSVNTSLRETERIVSSRPSLLPCQSGWIGRSVELKAEHETTTEDEDTEEVAAEIIEESAEMGDWGAKSSPEGQTCARCDRNAVSGPGGMVVRKASEGVLP